MVWVKKIITKRTEGLLGEMRVLELKKAYYWRKDAQRIELLKKGGPRKLIVDRI